MVVLQFLRWVFTAPGFLVCSLMRTCFSIFSDDVWNRRKYSKLKVLALYWYITDSHHVPTTSPSDCWYSDLFHQAYIDIRSHAYMLQTSQFSIPCSGELGLQMCLEKTIHCCFQPSVPPPLFTMALFFPWTPGRRDEKYQHLAMYV